MTLELVNITCGYGDKKIIENFSFKVDKGEILCLLGPNGVGKTTLFKTVIGFLKPLGGEILINRINSASLSDRQRANYIGYVPQAHVPPFPFDVLEVVLMGRTPKLGMFASPGKKDKEIAASSLERLGISHLASRIYTELSGGERQMVLIARAMAAGANLLLLDEPTSNLDFGNQVRVLANLNRLAEEGYSIIMTSHHPEHAFQMNCKVALIQEKSRVLFGDAASVVTSANLFDTYGIDVEVADVRLSDGRVISSCIPVIK